MPSFIFQEVFMPYKTIYAEAKDSFIEQKSEFIGYIAPVKTGEEAVAFINKVEAENRKARHNCYAYVLKEGNISRFSDNGEPQGTAGPPILDVIVKNGLSDVCIVVTRYFGGILLGKGGLTRAYSTGASMAVSAAKIASFSEAYSFKLRLDYSFYDKLCRVLTAFGAVTINTDFAEEVEISLVIKKDSLESLKKQVADLGSGSILLSELTELLYDFGE